MSSVIVAGDTSGTVTLQAPAVAGTTVITLPATSGTMITTTSNGQVIPKAALPTGSVLQVVRSHVAGKASTSSSSETKLATSAAITPTSSSSKIFVHVTSQLGNDGTSGNAMFGLVRTIGATDTNICSGYTLGNKQAQTTAYQYDAFAWNELDSPATTSAITYSLTGYRGDGLATPFCGGRATDNYYGTGVMFILMEIAA